MLSDRMSVIGDLAKATDVERLETRIERKLESLEARIENLRLSLEGRIDNRFGELMRWMLALFVPLYLATLLALVAVTFKL